MDMLAFVAVGLVLFGHQRPDASAQQKKSLFDQIVETPTGSNGYEDYLRVADALSDPSYNEITSAIDRLANPTAEYEKPFPEWAKGKSRLELERMRVNKFEPALRWIHDGNLKEVHDPRSTINDATLFLEYAPFKRIAKFAASDAKVHLADGDPEGAARVLADALQFAYNIRKTTLMSDLVGIACEGIVLAAIEQHLDSFSEAGWDLLMEQAKDQINAPPPLASALANEKQMHLEFLQEFVKRSTEPPDTQDDNWLGDEDIDAAVEKFRVMSPDDKKAVLDDAQQLIVSTIDSTVQSLQGPEKTWPMVHDSVPTSVAQSIADYRTRMDVAACQSDLRNRIQLRLLVVHGLIEKYRLEMDRLPTKLEELNAPSLVIDPVNNKLFIYQLIGPTYRLASQGTKDYGMIELKYRRASSGTPVQDDDKPDVP